jgi:hypothetical protein
MNVGDFSTISAVAGPFLLLVGGYLINKRLQRANADKVDAEADLANANADKASADVQGIILANTKQLLAEARAVQAEKDAIKDERIGQLNSRVYRMEDRFESLRTALSTHGVWDAAALYDLRDFKPEYPAPPPFPEMSDDERQARRDDRPRANPSRERRPAQDDRR